MISYLSNTCVCVVTGQLQKSKKYIYKYLHVDIKGSVLKYSTTQKKTNKLEVMAKSTRNAHDIRKPKTILQTHLDSFFFFSFYTLNLIAN